MDTGACTHLADALRMLPSLQRLDLAYLDIGYEGLRTLLPLLSTRPTPAKFLAGAALISTIARCLVQGSMA